MKNFELTQHWYLSFKSIFSSILAAHQITWSSKTSERCLVSLSGVLANCAWSFSKYSLCLMKSSAKTSVASRLVNTLVVTFRFVLLNGFNCSNKSTENVIIICLKVFINPPIWIISFDSNETHYSYLKWRWKCRSPWVLNLLPCSYSSFFSKVLQKTSSRRL